jgi:hypothetical protein
MKQLVITLFLISNVALAAKNSKVDGKTINIDGHYNETKNVQVDEELKSLRTELKNVKTLKKNYQKKEKMYGKLVQESEGLKENFENYLEQRDEWNDAIGGYNQLLECTKSKSAKDCLKRRPKKKAIDRGTRRQKQSRNYAPSNFEDDLAFDDMNMDSVTMSNSATSRPGLGNYIRSFDQSVAGKAMDLNLCYKQSQTKQQGTLPVMMKVGPNGRLDHLTFIDTTQIYNRYLVNCLTRVLYSINYPRTPNNKLVSIKKIFTFELHHI